MSKTKVITSLVAILVILVGAGLYVSFTPKLFDKPVATSASIGGDFTLVDHHGKIVTQDDYKGIKKIIFFGFTNCPAVCPTELYNIATSMEEIGAENAKKFQVLFVSIDPEYDTPERMKEYVTAFDDRFIGLVGDVAQTSKIAKAFRIYYAKVPVKDSELGYTMDHSAYTYIMDENNNYLAHMSPNSEIEDMVKILKKFL